MRYATEICHCLLLPVRHGGAPVPNSRKSRRTQSDDAGLLMEGNLNEDAGAYFKRIEIYQKLSQTGRPCVRVGGVGGEEFTQQTSAGISGLSKNIAPV